MKKFRPLYFVYALLVIVLLDSSCSSTKQAFYFNPAPATPKVAAKPAAEPVYSASSELTIADIPVNNTTEPAEQAVPAKTISKKELRKLVKQTIKSMRDSSEQKNGNKRFAAKVNKEKLTQLQTEMKDLKNSVKLEEDDKKAVVSVKKPSTTLNQTELILVGIGALLVLIILLSLPVIGTLLGIILALGIIALALGLLLGYIEIDGF